MAESDVHDMAESDVHTAEGHIDADDRPTVRLVTHCRRCHGWLLSPRSVAEGIGPTCAIRERADLRAAATELALFDLT